MADNGDKGPLPPSLARAWGLCELPDKGPKRGLSVERIVHATIKIARTEGLSAVTMNRVAASLGTVGMSLYRYVSNKDELVSLMVDSAYGTPPDPAGPGEGWRTALHRWAHGELAVLQRHPWVINVPISGPPITPNLVNWFERGLRCFAGTALSEGEKVLAVLLVSSLVRSQATLTTQLTARVQAGRSGDPGARLTEQTSGYGDLLRRLIDKVRFPALSAAVKAGVFDGSGAGSDDPGNLEFDFGLNRILDGIETFMHSSTNRSRGTGEI